MSQGVALTDEPQNGETNKQEGVYFMARFIHPKIKKLQEKESREKYQDEQDKKEFFKAYKKENDKRKKLDMLHEAHKNAWI